MAFILAINPAGSHSSTLTDVARELKGHEVVGAESNTVAVAAVRQRPPDLILLPSTPLTGEQDLLQALRWVPGGVRLLRLPPASVAESTLVLKRVRALL